MPSSPQHMNAGSPFLPLMPSKTGIGFTFAIRGPPAPCGGSACLSGFTQAADVAAYREPGRSNDILPRRPSLTVDGLAAGRLWFRVRGGS